jgi:hypothetical protein
MRPARTPPTSTGRPPKAARGREELSKGLISAENNTILLKRLAGPFLEIYNEA